MEKITPAEFTDSFEPLGKIVINSKEYSVMPPKCLPEKFYLHYYEARADIMDIVSEFTLDENASDMKKQAAQTRMDGYMISPARRQIEALVQEEKDSLSISPGLVIDIYNEVERLLQDYYSQSSSTKDVPQPSKQANKESTSSKKTSSTNT